MCRTMDAAERRKQMIQESKFLGGDMEHTHLVKGLDYALLQKVRSEIEQLEEEEDEQLEQAVDGEKAEKEIEKKKEGDDEIQFKTIIGKNIFRYIASPCVSFTLKFTIILFLGLYLNQNHPKEMNIFFRVEWRTW